MSLKGNIVKAAARKAKVSPGELKHISGKEKLNFIREAMNHLVQDLKTNDQTLHNTMQKSMAESNTELSQLHPQMRRWMEKPGSFATWFEKTVPFVVYGGYVWNCSGGTLAADVKDTLESYVASKISERREGKGATSRQNRIRSNQSVVNMNNVTTKLAAIRAGN